jgi:hypothetical protein
MNPESHLIRPTANWASEEWLSMAWNPEAEKIHGISLERLMDEGLDVRTSAERVLESFRGKFLISDNPAYDAVWLTRLFQAADMSELCPRLHCPHRCVFAIESGGVPDETCLLEYGDNQWVLPEKDWSVFNVCDDLVRGAYPKPHRAGADALFVMAHVRAQVDLDFRTGLRPIGSPIAR